MAERGPHHPDRQSACDQGGSEGTGGVGQQPARVQIELDMGLCMAHGICIELAPAYFVSDGDGYVSLIAGAQELGESTELQLAASSCPMRVISTQPVQSSLPTPQPTGAGEEAS
jgi:ferredoxin